MIAVDTSALMAIILEEPEAEACAAALEAEPNVLISAGTAAEAFIVAGRRRVLEEMRALIGGFMRASIQLRSCAAAGTVNTDMFRLEYG